MDKVHVGKSDSSVLYIPVTPLTEANARYLQEQRNSFIEGTPPRDFPGGEGERAHIGRSDVSFAEASSGLEGLQALGLRQWDETAHGLSHGESNLLRRANQILGF